MHDSNWLPTHQLSSLRQAPSNDIIETGSSAIRVHQTTMAILCDSIFGCLARVHIQRWTRLQASCLRPSCRQLVRAAAAVHFHC